MWPQWDQVRHQGGRDTVGEFFLVCVSRSISCSWSNSAACLVRCHAALRDAALRCSLCLRGYRNELLTCFAFTSFPSLPGTVQSGRGSTLGARVCTTTEDKQLRQHLHAAPPAPLLRVRRDTRRPTANTCTRGCKHAPVSPAMSGCLRGIMTRLLLPAGRRHGAGGGVAYD